MGKRIITLLTDYGTIDSYVGQLKGVIKSLAPEADLVDISHDIPPGDIFHGAYVLAEAARCFPEGSIHLAVVDPTVGSNRQRIISQTSSATFVGPDNGLLSLAAPKHLRVGTWRIENVVDVPRHFPATTFDGRNFFAPLAAKLSLGRRPEEFGELCQGEGVVELVFPPVAVGENGETIGELVYFDRFGNAASNIGADCCSSNDVLTIERLGLKLKKINSFSELKDSEPGFLVNSQGMLEIALYNNSAERVLELRRGERLRLEKR